jgi:hypothetical protein
MLADLYRRLVPDPWRVENGFSADIAAATERLLTATTDDERSAVLGEWLERYQPCLFGRIAARKGLISYCFLTESDLEGSDLTIRAKIQSARTLWTRLAYEGKRSAFILIAISDTLVNASPDGNLLAFTKQLASLFLLQDVVQDQIYLDEIFLEMPGSSKATWRWNVGINYFGISGDKRWWQDHRIPGGLGFSTNSVGHLVKSGQIAEKMSELQTLLDVADEELVSTKVDSLPKALEWAMRTIHNASDGPSGKATRLLPLPDASSAKTAKCPIALPKFLQDRDYSTYHGGYHTDITIPSEYFIGDAERPSDLPLHRLDFTYLFNPDIENPDFITTATGRRVRGMEDTILPPQKVSRAVSSAESIAAHPRLVEALRGSGE